MPKAVDVAARLTLIAEATLAVARRQGLEATTIRAVAQELGRSTVFITNYVSTRAELLLNVRAHIEQSWAQELVQLGEGSDGERWLREIIRWSTQASERDLAVRQMWLEILSAPSLSVPLVSRVRLSARKSHERLLDAVADAGRNERLADVLFLALRGYFVSSVEDPERWHPDRARKALDALLALEER